MNSKRPVAIRYPKLSCPSELPSFEQNVCEGRGILLKNAEFAPELSVDFEDGGDKVSSKKSPAKKMLLVSTGGIFDETLVVARNLLQKGVNTDIYSLRFIKPFDENYFLSLAKDYDEVAVIEDGVKTGGVGEYIENLLFEHDFRNVKLFAFPEKFIGHGTRAEVLNDAGLSARKIVERILASDM